MMYDAKADAKPPMLGTWQEAYSSAPERRGERCSIARQGLDWKRIEAARMMIQKGVFNEPRKGTP